MRGAKRIALGALLGLALAAVAADGPPAEVLPPQPAAPAAPPANPFPPPANAAPPGAADAEPAPRPKLFKGRLRQRLRNLFHLGAAP